MCATCVRVNRGKGGVRRGPWAGGVALSRQCGDNAIAFGFGFGSRDYISI